MARIDIAGAVVANSRVHRGGESRPGGRRLVGVREVLQELVVRGESRLLDRGQVARIRLPAD